MRKILAMLLICILVFMLTGCDSSDYKKAMSMYENGEYKEAAEIFAKLGDYEDSAEMAVKAEKQWALVTYADVFETLKQETWYFNGGSDTTLNYLTFTDEEATVGQVYFDGNGIHENGSNACAYVVDDTSVTITMADGTEMAISYEKGDAGITLDKEYVSFSDVKKGLMGYWKSTSKKTIIGILSVSEDNIYVGEDTLESESASLAYGGSNGEYYYYGPYKGTYTLGIGCFETEMKHGDAWFFNIIDGKPTMLHYDKVCTPTDGFPRKDGYSFS